MKYGTRKATRSRINTANVTPVLELNQPSDEAFYLCAMPEILTILEVEAIPANESDGEKPDERGKRSKSRAVRHPKHNYRLLKGGSTNAA